MERIEVNLLPAEYRIHTSRFHLRREIVYPLLFLVVVAAFLGITWINTNTKIADQKSAIYQVEQQIGREKHIHNEILQLRTEQSMINNKIQALQKIDINRERWVRLQEVFSRRLPEQTWLTVIEETSGGVISSDSTGSGARSNLLVKGKTYSFAEVAIFMSALESSEYILEVGLSRVEQNTNGKEFDFSISCVVNPDAQLITVLEGF